MYSTCIIVLGGHREEEGTGLCEETALVMLVFK